MLTYFKIKLDLSWDESPKGRIFVVIIATTEHEFGSSTHVCANTKYQKDVTSMCHTSGCSTIKVLSQFDVKLETSICSLDQGMTVVGLNALNVYIDEKRATPFQHADLKKVMDGALITATEAPRAQKLGYASPLS